MYRLEEWALVSTSDPDTAPELVVGRISGRVYEHPTYPNGTRIMTGALESINPIAKTIKTETGSIYFLGSVDPAWEKQFTNAENRFWENNKDLVKTDAGLILG